jgi:pseudaminic acid cytidylyltransferase
VNIAIIPARGKSKRIPRKNLRQFLGRPVISYPIAAAKQSGLFERVIVSTEDDEIAKLSISLGAEVPFRRSPELSDDHTSTDEVLIHGLGECLRLYGAFERACCIYPTTPLMTVDLLRRGLDLLLAHSASTSFPVTRYEAPLGQAFVLEGFRPVPRWPDQMLARSQDLPEHYHDAGMFYWVDVPKFLDYRALYNPDAVAFAIPRSRCQDINTLEDWTEAELKYQLLSQRDPQ